MTGRFHHSLASVLCVCMLACALAAPASAQFPPAIEVPRSTSGLAETIEAIDSARVRTRILYITAHPDDESASLLTYLARALHADVTLLTLTRGEGGQNALGPEQAPQFGLIRTSELLAATQGYGVHLRFTRAPDFGFSKTAEETLRIWGDQVLEDMVREIRMLRPHVVINGWGGVRGGHGNHQASGMLTPKAVEAAADPKQFPELGRKEFLSPWKVPLLLEPDRSGANAAGGSEAIWTVPVDEISPLWGVSYREMALKAFANHRSQGITGFLNSPFLRQRLRIKAENGQPFDKAMLAMPITTTVPNESKDEQQRADRDLAEAREAALRLDWPGTVKVLAGAGREIESIFSAQMSRSYAPPGFDDLPFVQERINKALALAAAIRIEAQSDRSEVVAGETFSIRGEARAREAGSLQLGKPELVAPEGWTSTQAVAEGGGVRFEVSVPPDAQQSGSVADKMLPFAKPLLNVKVHVVADGYGFDVWAPVLSTKLTTTRADTLPVRLEPAYAIVVEPRQFVVAQERPPKQLEVHLRVHSFAAKPAKVTIGLDVPKDWRSSPPAEFDFAGSDDQLVRFTVTPPEHFPPGSYAIGAYAKRGGEKFTTSVEPLPSLPTQFWSEPAECKVRAFRIVVPENLRVGYVTAEGEPIPEALARLGIRVEDLDSAALAFGDLSKFDAIVVGVRAYELRPDLVRANQRLLDYAAAGGTLIVQYNRDFAWNNRAVAPYPAKIGSPTLRITDENSPVRFLLPDDPLLNFPNKITQDDFNGWIQERGLYYWGEFDARYQAVLAMHDPGEKELNGGLVYTRFGKGIYIYTGIAFFRQLPEGVPGAYRLFVNLLSQSRAKP
ncbi:MAG TPA: PIG-L family deacetylase [Candidatus Acidoferrales bacterium]|nr:PIG-L family deacetylase [Candidatus Acidoferrales bacterium]